MTQPAPRVVNLPEAEPPVVTRVIADRPRPPIVNGRVESAPPLTWVYNGQDPLDSTRLIVRMFLDRGEGVDVYSLSGDRTNGVRYFIPSHLIRFVEEIMPLDMFAAEIDAEQRDEDENAPALGEEEEEDEAEQDQTPPSPPPNGQS